MEQLLLLIVAQSFRIIELETRELSSQSLSSGSEKFGSFSLEHGPSHECYFMLLDKVHMQPAQKAHSQQNK
jgi:hypothetical protein